MYRGFATVAALAAAVFICVITTSSRTTVQQKQIPPELHGHAAVAEIILPAELEVEKPATLSVIDSDGMVVEGAIVSLPGGRKVTTDATGRARFVVTSDPGAFIAEVPASVLQLQRCADILSCARIPRRIPRCSPSQTIPTF